MALGLELRLPGDGFELSRKALLPDHVPIGVFSLGTSLSRSGGKTAWIAAVVTSEMLLQDSKEFSPFDGEHP
jgi:hypothetical protein